MTNNRTILIVDDDDDILNMTSFVLRNLGYSVRTALGGEAGLSALRNREVAPCLILLDLMMPLMDGATFRKKLLEMPEAADVPVIILSGDSGLAKKAAELKVSGFEQKPISVDRLAAVAARFCKSSSIGS